MNNLNDFSKKTPSEILEAINNDKGNAFISVNQDLKTSKVVALKDIHVAKDDVVTNASEMLKDFYPNYQSTVVQNLIDAGYEIVGRTNLDEFAMGSTNKTSFFGSVDNVVDPKYISGGSSGGSAYAVAKGLVPVATGTDTGGSVRQPAAFNGVYGMKPTYGLISRYGTLSFASSFDTVGLISACVRDNAQVLKALAKTDDYDQTSFCPADFDPLKTIDLPISDLKIGVMNEWINDHIDPEIKAALDLEVKKLKDQGLTVDNIDVDLTKHSYELYIALAYAEGASNLNRYDGIKFGKNTYQEDGDVYKLARDSFGIQVKKRLIIGTYMTSSENSKKYYTHAQKIRRQMQIDFDKLYEKYDIIIGPTVPNLATLKDAPLDSKENNLADQYAIPANLCGFPAMSVPIAQAKDGRHIGMQVMAKHYNENLIYQFAASIKGETNE